MDFSVRGSVAAIEPEKTKRPLDAAAMVQDTSQAARQKGSHQQSMFRDDRIIGNL